MRRKGIFLFLTLLIIGSGSLYGVMTNTIINFTTFDSYVRGQFENEYSTVVYNNGIPEVRLGYHDYLLSNWTVLLNSSSADVQNMMLSYCLPVVSKTQFGGSNVLGIRVHFPDWNNNSYAVIQPPYPIKVYDTNGDFINQSNGVLSNAMDIISMSVWVNGRGYNYQMAVRLRDRENNIHEYALGSLDYQGWRRLVWENLNYSDKILDWGSLGGPSYPKDTPYFAFDSIVIYRMGSEPGGDFVTYVGRIDVEYLPFNVSEERDIDDEDAWHIISDRGQVLQYFEDQAMIKEILLYEQMINRMTNGGL